MAEPIRVDPVSRRTVLKGIAGAAGLVSIPAIIAACSTTGSLDRASAPPAARVGRQRAGSVGGASAATGSLSVGSYNSDPARRRAWRRSTTRSRPRPASRSTLNTVDHNTFQDQITNYLGATPDTVYTWFSGFRMKFFADQGLNTAIDDVWAKSRATSPRASPTSVVGNDGKVYGIPVDYYPWAVFYRKSVFADKGYTVPTTWDELKALCKKMQTDGLTPIAFGDKDGWPAMGTFDILNLRLNGYDFHVGLMAGKEKWTDPKVTAVFQKWAEFLPYPRQGLRGPDLAERRRHARPEEVRDVPARPVRLGAVRGDQGPGRPRRPRLLPVPDPRAPQFDAEKRARRPDRHLQITAKSPKLAAELDAAKAYLEFWSKGSTQLHHVQEPAGPHPDGHGRRHQQLQRPPEEGRRDRQRGARRSPSSSTATRAPTSPARTARRASSRSSWPTRPRTWPPTRRPSRTSGISFRPLA